MNLLIVLLLFIFSNSTCFVWNGSEFIGYTILGIVNNSVVLQKQVYVDNVSVNVVNRGIDVYNISINIINKSVDVENVSVNVINKILNVTNIDVIQHNRTIEYVDYELYRRNVEDMGKQFNNLQNLLYIILGGIVFIIIKDKLNILSERK